MAKNYEENYDEMIEETEVAVEEKKHPVLDFIRKHPKGCAIAAAFVGTVLGGLIGVEIGKNCFEMIEDGDGSDVDAIDVTDSGDGIQVTEL